MFKYFLKPLRIILVGYLIGGLGIASDIAQLTDFNLLDFIKTHSPQSFYLMLGLTLLAYSILVIIEFARKKPIQASSVHNHNYGQLVSTRDVKDSTIIQIKRGNEG